MTLDPDASNLRHAFGQRLRSLRLDRFWSQEQLCEASGVSRATVARLEAGTTKPQLRTVVSLAKALDVDPSELVADPAAFWTD